ncbi:uroporphyrinogen-III synthase [Francisellaceae bacterium]|nr:uroporphyrinogen-III synthase [Francisellaceae bacterium]
MAEALAFDLEKAGVQTAIWPCIEVEAKNFSHSLQYLKQDVHCVFISQNAVRLALENKACFQQLKKMQSFYAIGQATAELLQKTLGKEVIYPGYASSEALLDLENLQNTKNKKFAIFRGGEGRELIKDTLEKRGALVDYIECYSRKGPSAESTALMAQRFQNGETYDWIIFTSFQALQNAWSALDGPSVLLKSKITVTNDRMLAWAQDKGFQSILRLNNMSSHGILESLGAVYE